MVEKLSKGYRKHLSGGLGVARKNKDKAAEADLLSQRKIALEDKRRNLGLSQSLRQSLTETRLRLSDQSLPPAEQAEVKLVELWILFMIGNGTGRKRVLAKMSQYMDDLKKSNEDVYLELTQPIGWDDKGDISKARQIRDSIVPKGKFSRSQF